MEAVIQTCTGELVHAHDQAEAANRAKSAFSANVTHELRTLPQRYLGRKRARAPPPGRCTRDGARLEARLFAERQGGCSWLLTLEETVLVNDTPSSLGRLGLTARETEVLYWIAHGKSNPEIAIILEAALNTVKRRVHSILGKLGVESRLAAALQAAKVSGLRYAG